MQFFLDTALIAEIREIAAWGVLDGVTTNPSLVAKTGQTFRQVLAEICAAVSGPVSAEVTATDTEGILTEARALAQVAPNIVVKVPMILAGLKAVPVLAREGIKTNVTLVFQPVQALLAARAGAAYVSPFLGRLDDLAENGIEMLEEMRLIFDRYGFETQILAASLRHPLHVKQVALAGADVATIPFGVFKRLLDHPLTDLGLARFLDDWQSVPR